MPLKNQKPYFDQSNQAGSKTTNPKSKLPKIEPQMQKLAEQSKAKMNPSFQLKPEEKEKISDKAWAHWALLLIPVALALSIIVLAVNFFLNNRFEGGLAGKHIRLSERASSVTSPAALPIVQDESKRVAVRAYFSSVSAYWKEEFMSIIPDVAASSYIEYADEEDENKLSKAQAFYIYLNNPTVREAGDQFAMFLSDVRDDLESSLGQDLF